MSRLEEQLHIHAPHGPTAAEMQEVRDRFQEVVEAYEAVHGPIGPNASLAERSARALSLTMSELKAALGMDPYH